MRCHKTIAPVAHQRAEAVSVHKAINLGVVTKIHRRTAIVAHVSKGGTGLMMESLTGTR